MNKIVVCINQKDRHLFFFIFLKKKDRHLKTTKWTRFRSRHGHMDKMRSKLTKVFPIVED